MAAEVWQRGVISGVPSLLQPVAHAWLQAVEEVNELMKDFPEELLWDISMSVACPGFHLNHMRGVIDRLLTYADGNQLNEYQLEFLGKENYPDPSTDSSALVRKFSETVADAVKKLSSYPEERLTEFRGIGRKQIPSTVIGLLFHSAEHVMRHLGQLLVTVKVLKENNNSESENAVY